MSIANHRRTNDFMHVHQDERRPITAKAPKGPVTICPGCGGALAQSNWSNAKRLGTAFCEITCALLKQATQRDASGGAA